MWCLTILIILYMTVTGICLTIPYNIYLTYNCPSFRPESRLRGRSSQTLSRILFKDISSKKDNLQTCVEREGARKADWGALMITIYIIISLLRSLRNVVLSSTDLPGNVANREVSGRPRYIQGGYSTYLFVFKAGKVWTSLLCRPNASWSRSRKLRKRLQRMKVTYESKSSLNVQYPLQKLYAL